MKEKTFMFRGREYEYFWHIKNARNNERTVEVPIIWSLVQKEAPFDILEIGNVLNHYYKHAHTVVDKYEKYEGVLNEDIVNYSPGRLYKLIVSISTFEHIGWSKQKDPPKIIRAVDHVKTLLAPGGKLVVTVPFGFNSYMDSTIATREIFFDQMAFLKRVSRHNLWKEVQFEEALHTSYHHPYPCANGILVGTIYGHIPS